MMRHWWKEIQKENPGMPRFFLGVVVDPDSPENHASFIFQYGVEKTVASLKLALSYSAVLTKTKPSVLTNM